MSSFKNAFGSSGGAVGGGGGILLQTATVVDTTNRSTTSATFTASGVEATLANTLKDTGSRVRIRVQGVMGSSASVLGWLTLASWDGATETDLTPVGMNAMQQLLSASISDVTGFSFEFVHTPGSTTPLTYRLLYRVQSTGTMYLGRRATDTNANCPTFITVEELD